MTESVDATDLQEPVNEPIAPVEEGQKPTLNQAQVNDIVKREKQRAYEKGRREAMAELESAQVPQQAAPAQPQSLGGMQQLSQDDIRRMVAEVAPQALQEHVNHMRTKQTVESFVSKVQSAEQKYPGLQEKLKDLDYESLAPLVELANDMPNTGDIMHELVSHPMKMGNLLTLMYTQPRMAKNAMMELSNSIKQNEEAKAQEVQARDPMSQLKPSTNAGLDDGSMSVSDFRKMFRR